MGVPHGSILSVTLFSVTINYMANALNDNTESYLYVDDFLVCYLGKILIVLEDNYNYV
jgi:hypothetical protein